MNKCTWDWKRYFEELSGMPFFTKEMDTEKITREFCGACGIKVRIASHAESVNVTSLYPEVMELGHVENNEYFIFKAEKVNDFLGIDCLKAGIPMTAFGINVILAKFRGEI